MRLDNMGAQVRQLGVALCLVLATLGMPAQAFGNFSKDVDRLVKVSGLEQQLSISSDEAASVFSSQFLAASQLDMGSDFETMVRDTLAGHGLLASVRQSLAGGLNKKQLQQLLKWYESAAGRRVTELEIAAEDPAQMERMMAQINSLQSDAKEMARAERMDRTLGVTDKMIHSMKVTQRALLEAMLDSSDAPEQARQSALDNIDQTVEGSRSEMQQFAWAITAYTYRSLSDAEYDDYLQFLETPAAKKLHELIVEAANASVAKTYSKLGSNIKQRLQKLGDRPVEQPVASRSAP